MHRQSVNVVLQKLSEVHYKHNAGGCAKMYDSLLPYDNTRWLHQSSKLNKSLSIVHFAHLQVLIKYKKDFCVHDVLEKVLRSMKGWP